MNKKSMVKSAAVIMILTFLGKLLGFVKEALIAREFGASFSSDVYVFSYGIMDMLFILIGGTLGTTFIPMLAGFIKDRTFKDRNYFVNNILSIFILFALILGIGGIIHAEYIVKAFGPGFSARYSPAQFKIVVDITRLMIISLVFIVIQSILTAVLQSHGKFAVPASISICSNAVIMAYLIFLVPEYGLYGLAGAIILGFIVQAVVHIPQFRSLGYRFRFSINLKYKPLREMAGLAMPVLIGLSASQVNLLVNRMLATNAGEGSLAIINYSNKLIYIVYMVLAGAIAAVIYPNLSSLLARKDMDGFKDTLTRSINTLVLVLVPALVGLCVLRAPIIDAVYRRGAFDGQAALRTSYAVLFYSPGLIAYGIRDILNKAFFSLKDTKTPVINSILGIGLNIILSCLLVGRWGVNGLAAASSISSITVTALLLRSLSRKTGFEIKTISRTFLKTVLAASVMALLVSYTYGLMLNLTGTGFMSGFLLIGVNALAGMVVYAAVLEVIRVEEYRYVIRLLKSRFKKVD